MAASLQPLLHDSRGAVISIGLHLFTIITSRWLEVWQPGSVAVIDESVYEYVGESPVHVCVPSILISPDTC